MILVTGAAGFIGSNLVAALNEDGRDDLVLCDWLGEDGRWQNLAKRCFLDFLSPDQLAGYLETREARRITLVLHMGAVSDTTAADGDLVMRRNYQFTRMLWRWCAERGVTFLYASSAATYGDGSAGFDDRADLAAVKRLRPLNLYGWSKHAFDLFALAQQETPPPAWYGCKFFNVFGPNEYHKEAMRSVICKVAPEIIADRPVELFRSHREGFADGGQLRDFIGVDDACAAVLHLARGTAPSGLYNVGTGRARSFLDLVSAGFHALGREAKIRYVPMPEVLRGRYQYFTQAETAKLRATGFAKPCAELETAVSGYMLDHLAKEDRYR